MKNLNRVRGASNFVINFLVGLLSILCIIPFIFVIIISFTDETCLAANGYSFLPEKFSTEAYKYIFTKSALIINSLGVSLLVVVVGTVLSLLVVGMYAYTLYRQDYKFRKFFNWLSFITMIFGSGLVPSYVMISQVLELKNSLWALIIPVLCSPFNIIILRTFYSTNIPSSLIESSMIDGSSEFRTFFKIVAPISLPGLATIALFCALNFWNDWFYAMLYIDEATKIPLQYLLMKIQNNINFLTASTEGTAENAEALRNMPSESARMALVVIIVTPIAFAYPFFQKYFISGLTIGSVKG